MKRLLFGTGTFLGLLVGGCSGISNPNQIVFPADSVSYAKQVEPYFTLACNSSGCHNAIDLAGGVDLSSWTAIRSTPGLVDVNPQYDTTSTLLLVMNGKLLHNAPINSNQNQRDGIKEWIIEGAKNN